MELRGSNPPIETLTEGDFAQEPIRVGGFGNVLSAVREEHLAVDGVPVPSIYLIENAIYYCCRVSVFGIL